MAKIDELKKDTAREECKKLIAHGCSRTKEDPTKKRARFPSP